MTSNVTTLPSSINDLPDECLREIMLSVPVIDRINLRRVSKKWCEVIDDCWREVKNLMIVKPSSPDDKPGITGTGDTIRIVTPQRDVLKEVVERYVTEVEDDFEWNIYIPAEDEEELWVPAQKIHKEIIQKCYALEKLTSHFVDEEFIVLISQNIQLLELCLEFNAYCPPEIDILKPILEPIINLKNLKRLSIVGPTTEYKNRRIRSPIPMTSYFPWMLSMNLRKLESLTLGTSMEVKDGSILGFGAVPPPEHLGTDGNVMIAGKSYQIEDYNLYAITATPSLREMRIDGCARIEGEMFGDIFHLLEVISFTDCSVTNDNMINLLLRTESLKSLYLDNTLVTDDGIISAMNRTKKPTFFRPRFYFIVSETPSRLKITWNYLNN